MEVAVIEGEVGCCVCWGGSPHPTPPNTHPPRHHHHNSKATDGDEPFDPTNPFLTRYIADKVVDTFSSAKSASPRFEVLSVVPPGTLSSAGWCGVKCGVFLGR